jgi:response regulator RpfG family c-di-GMP phosphodiesterase
MNAKQRILVVDDEPVNISVLTEILKNDYECTGVTDPSKVLALAMTAPLPDLILLDIIMPELDGFAICRQLKATPSVREIPVIFVTAKDDARDEALGFEAGAADYITKPVSPAIVAARVHLHLSLHAQTVELRDLLSNTLMGSIRVLTDVLLFADPQSFAQAPRLKRYARGIAGFLKVPEAMQIELAAMLSHIGCVTVSPRHSEQQSSDQSLPEASRPALHAHPSHGQKLLINIPRLEMVAKMVGLQQAPLPKPDLPADLLAWDPIMLGGQILKVVINFDQLVMGGQLPKAALLQMGRRVGEYAPGIVAALKAVYEQEGAITSRKVHLADMRPGMILLEDVESVTGEKLLKRNSELSQNMIVILQTHAQHSSLKEPVEVLDPSTR